MNIKKDEWGGDTYYLNFNENCFAHIQNDWKQLFGKWNWITFHFIHIYFEKDTMTKGYEFEMMLLGFGFRVRYNYDPTYWDNKIKEIENEKL